MVCCCGIERSENLAARGDRVTAEGLFQAGVVRV